MKPRVIDSKTWKVCPKQLADLDRAILDVYPNAKLSHGIKYERWAEVDSYESNQFYLKEYHPDNVFRGDVFGRNKIVLMWMPFFD